MFRKQVCKLFCHKCGASIHEGNHYCSNCGAKVGNVNVDRSKVETSSRNIVWLLPVITFFVAVVVIGCFYMYETNTNIAVEDMVKEGETKALKGDLLSAKEVFEQVLQKRPQHVAAAFNLEVIERGQQYEEWLDEAASFAEKKQFDEGLRILEKLERDLAEEDGPFFVRIKEQSGLQTASLTVASADQVHSENQMMEHFEELLEKTKDFTSEEAAKMTELLKGKIINLSVDQGKEYLQKYQFTEAELEFDRGLSYDPTNEKLLAYKETVKNERIAFKKEEQKRLEKAMAKAAEEEHFNWNEAIKELAFEYSYDEDNGELYVFGKVKNVGTRPINEIDAHYLIFDEDRNELTKYWTNVSPSVLMPNGTGYFEETLLISEFVGIVEIVDYYWTVQGSVKSSMKTDGIWR